MSEVAHNVQIMSLTGHLKNQSSQIWKFFDENLPHTNFQPFRRLALECSESRSPNHDSTLREDVNQAGLWDPGLPSVLPKNPENYPWMGVGTSFDYRLRYFLEVTPTERLVASKGALQVAVYFGIAGLPLAFEQLQTELDRLAPELGPQVLAVDKERHLGRLCFVLALYESWYRAPTSPNDPILRLGEDASLHDLMKLCRDDVAEDLASLAKLFYASQKDLLGRRPIVLNPTFSASEMLGGADADLILGHRLIDIKTVKKAEADRPNLWQLAGYFLADLEDHYGIDEVGFYFSRHGSQIAWRVEDFFNQLAGHHVDLKQLRQQFKAVLQTQ